VGWRGPAAAAAVATIIVAVCSWPWPKAPTRWIIGGSHNDANGILWGLEHVATHLTQGQLPALYTAEVLYPEGALLRVANLPEAVLVAPITIGFGAIAAFNLLTVLHHALAAAAGWWCGQRICGTRGAAALVAAAFAFAPVLCGTTFNQNPDVTAWYWIPLTAGLAWRATGPRSLVLAGLCAGAAALCNPYGGVMAGLTFLALAPTRPIGNWLRGTAVLGAGLWAGWWLVGVPASTVGSATAKAVRDNPFHGVATGMDLIQPWPTFLPQDSTWPSAVVAHFPYLGLALLGIGGIGLVRTASWRWLGLLILSVGLAMGPVIHVGLQIPSPVAWIEALTPLDRLHLSHRYTALAVLALAVGAARWLAGKSRWTWMAVGLISADFLWASAPTMFRAAAPFDDGACALLAELPDGPVFDLPGERGEQWMYSATCHGRPIASGLNRAMPASLEQQLRARPVDERLDVLRDAGFRYLVSHGRSRRRELGAWPGLTEAARSCVVAENRSAVRVMDLENCPR